ncbi:MAG: penicillin-insensitive murein endopeptidase [bacterium]
MRWNAIWSIGLAVCLFTADTFAEQPATTARNRANTVFYTVSDGDNLGSIALRFGVGVGEVKAWNALQTEELEPGREIIVKSDEVVKAAEPAKPLPVIHVVKRGDTFESIAKKHKVSIDQIKRWNRKVNPRKLQIGQQIRLQIPGRDGTSASWGTANRGRLYNGVAMQSVPGMRVRNVARAYGTKRVVQLLEAAAYDVRARWPDAPDIEVGDISFRSGGRMRPHKSHTSGRDADLSYYHRGNVPTGFRDMTPETFDAAKNWHVLKTLIDTKEVEYIFVDYRLQKVLYDYAQSIGYTSDELASIIQYPASASTNTAIIRHARGHDDHWHIRFTCGQEDKQCR